jgi:hypothetical protein
MKKFCLLTFYVFAAVLAYSQKVAEYKATNDVTYHVGDTLKLGKGSGPNDSFEYLQSGKMVGLLGNAVKASFSVAGNNVNSSDLEVVGKSFEGKSVIIKKIKKQASGVADKIVFSVSTGGVMNYNLMIDDALSSGEVSQEL